MNDQLLAAVSQYGAPALFGIVAIAAIGVPLPITLLLIVAGSMISQGAMNPWWAIGAAGAGSILGDQVGYAIGRWGGPAAVEKIGGLFGKRASLRAAKAKAKAWGGWDVLGELTGAAVYISLGRFFSDRVMALYAVLGDLTWAIAALLVAVVLGFQLVSHLRRPDAGW
jgi:membrane protein DedA with SNARE-associated domain